MARSKSLKVQNQLNNVKCNRMLIKGCDHLTDVELFYPTDYALLNEPNNRPTPGLSAFVNSSPPTKQQFQKHPMNSFQRRMNMRSNNSLDKLRLELENNLKRDNFKHNLTTISTNQLTTNANGDVSLSNDCSTESQVKGSNVCDLQSNETEIYSNGLNGFILNNSTDHLNEKSIKLENSVNIHKVTKLFNRKNSTGVPSQIDDNWLLNSKSTNYDLHFQAIKTVKMNAHSNNSTICSFDTPDNSTVILSGHLNELSTKSYWVFTCVNWKRRFCILDDYKLIIKSSNCQDGQTSTTIRLENYECSPVKLAKMSKRTANVFALHYSTESTPTTLLDFQYTFAANSQTEMLKWIENIRKAIGGARNERKSGRKKGKDVNDVLLDSIDETKALNVVKRPQGPRNRRLPKRQQPVKSEPNEICNKVEQETCPIDETHSVEQTNVNQFKLNLNELNNHRLKSTSEINKSTDKLEQEKADELIIDESSIKQNLSKIKLRARSMSDDLLDGETSVDESKNHSKLVKQNTADCNLMKQTNDTSPSIIQPIKKYELNQTEFNNVKQRREQLIEQLKQIDQTKSKCKSMVSLNHTSSHNEFDISSKPTFLPLKPTLKNRLEFNRSSPRLNAAKSSLKLDSPTNGSVVGKVVSLNSLNTVNNSNSTSVGVDRVCSPSLTKSTTLPTQLNPTQLKETKGLPCKVSNLKNSNCSTAISRNNSTSSNSSSTNSGHLTGLSSATDGQTTHSTAVEASRLQKKIQNKKAMKSKFYVHLDSEAESVKSHFSSRTTSGNQLNRNRSVANRASLNLNNNNEVDELTKKFKEKGLSASVNSLKLLSNDDQSMKDSLKKNESQRPLTIDKPLNDLIMPTIV